MKQRKGLILAIWAIAPFFIATAQQNDPDSLEMVSDSLMVDSIIGDLPESLDENMLKLMADWHSQHFMKTEDYCLDDEHNPVFPDDLYELRLQRMPCIIPMPYNKHVRTCIDLYAGKRRNLVRYMMGMADFFFPMMEQKLDAYGLPLELKYLACVESALKPTVQSRVGASGIWQFMLPTGRIYGLEINSLIDERLDPEKATEAACRYFKEMYELYGDWLLVVASYNCGPGGVNKAIRNAKGQTDFWKIFPYLPRETRSFVPLYIAAAYIMTYHCEHGLCPIRADFSVAVDTLMVNKALHFDQIAEMLQIDKEAVRFYNPMYKREIIPGHIEPSVLRLPVDRTLSFIDKSEDSIAMHRWEELLSFCIPVDRLDQESQKQTVTHIVEAGENVYTVANKYGVLTKDLQRWNNLRSSRLSKGAKLKVYVDNGGVPHPTATQTATTQKASGNTAVASTAGTAATRGASGAPATSAAKSAGNEQQTKGFVTYVVVDGDSLYGIAKKFPGMTYQKIQEANGLTTTNLRIGQVLKIPQG